VENLGHEAKLDQGKNAFADIADIAGILDFGS